MIQICPFSYWRWDMMLCKQTSPTRKKNSFDRSIILILSYRKCLDIIWHITTAVPVCQGNYWANLTWMSGLKIPLVVTMVSMPLLVSIIVSDLVNRTSPRKFHFRDAKLVVLPSPWRSAGCWGSPSLCISHLWTPVRILHRIGASKMDRVYSHCVIAWDFPVEI